MSLEMYEGKEQSNATTFFSIDSEAVPLVERQAYILPLDIVALEETIHLQAPAGGNHGRPAHAHVGPQETCSFNSCKSPRTWHPSLHS